MLDLLGSLRIIRIHNRTHGICKTYLDLTFKNRNHICNQDSQQPSDFICIETISVCQCNVRNQETVCYGAKQSPALAVAQHFLLTQRVIPSVISHIPILRKTFVMHLPFRDVHDDLEKIFSLISPSQVP
jgi:hypothetical protein